MSYRDDLEAAHERARELEEELAAVSKERDALKGRVETLEGELAAARKSVAEHEKRVAKQAGKPGAGKAGGTSDSKGKMSPLILVGVVAGPLLMLIFIVAPCGKKNNDPTGARSAQVVPSPACAELGRTSGDYTLKSNVERCDCGNPGHCAGAATNYLHGTGGASVDHAKAFEYFERACDSGNEHMKESCASAAWLIGSNLVARSDDRLLQLNMRGCELRSGQACNGIGWQAEVGRGVPKDLTVARQRYREGCELRYAAACDSLGRVLRDHEPRDEALAREAYTKACDMGHLDACASEAWYFEHGVGGEKSDQTAFQLHGRACEGKIGWACTKLGWMHAEGRGTVADPVAAAASFQKACNENDAAGCSDLGLAYERGRGVPRDYGQARLLYERSCAAKNAIACANVGLFHLNGRGVTPDDAKAVEAFQRACDLDPAQCGHLATMLAEGRGVGKDLTRAAGLLEDTCDRGTMWACTALGNLVRPDERATRLYEKACTGGDGAGCVELGRARVVKDPEMSARLFQQACDKDHADGCRELARLVAPKDPRRARLLERRAEELAP